METGITKDDLRQFGLLLKNDIRSMLEKAGKRESEDINPEWLKSRKVKAMLDMSPGSIQNLRISGKVRFKKVLGSYYYNRLDLEKLFNEGGSK